MARIEFHHHEKGNHEETWYYLARDDDGKAYVEHEFSGRPGEGAVAIGAPTKISLVEFLRGGGSAQDKLLKLIGTFVDD